MTPTRNVAETVYLLETPDGYYLSDNLAYLRRTTHPFEALSWESEDAARQHGERVTALDSLVRPCVVRMEVTIALTPLDAPETTPAPTTDNPPTAVEE